MSQTDNSEFDQQFKLPEKYYVEKINFVDWLRFFYAIEEILKFKPKSILDVGEGSGTVRKMVSSLVEKYETMDVNSNLDSTYLNDLRKYKAELDGKFDCIIAMEILEHICFSDFQGSLTNLYSYLSKNGKAIITIPYRASYFLWMTPHYIPHVLRIPTGFLSFGSFYRRFIKRKIWIDPNHAWEIGDGCHTFKQVENIMRKVGFKIEVSRRLVYAHFWILSKQENGND